MLSIDYQAIFSRFFTQVEGNEFAQIDKNYITEMLNSWLHSATSQINVRKMFSTLSLDDEIQVVDFEMKHSIDDESDKDFVIEVLGMGLGIRWLKPKILTPSNVRQMIGSKEEKWYSQQSHMAELRNLYDTFQKEQQKTISDRNTYYNSYIAKKKKER